MARKIPVDIKRRNFLIATAGAASSAIPGIAWAASKPCPPSSLGVSGGSATSTSCGAGALSPGQLPVLQLLGGGEGKPWTFGQPFRKGDVPSHLTATGPSAFQADVRTRWSDGSIKFAVVSGIGGTAIQFAPSTAVPSGRLTEEGLKAALPSTTIRVGSHVTTVNALIGSSAKQRTVFEGPVMSNWIYREPVAGSNHLVVWVDVRYYANGAVEVFPWVENGHLLVAGPTNAVVDCAVVIGGSTRFAQTLDIKHHTRVVLVNGQSFSHWAGADPGILPRHDSQYLTDTRLLPNYGWRSPSETALSRLAQSFSPNTLAGAGSAMGSAGGEGSVVAPSEVFYITSGGDTRAYRAAMTFGLSSGSWSIHYRDEATKEPFKFSSYPNLGTSPTLPAESGGTNGTDSITHLPGFAYLPYLITGRWWFLDELLFWAGRNFMVTNYRQGARSICDPRRAGSARMAAWGLNTLAHALCVLPESHPLGQDLTYAWEQNCLFYRTIFVTGGTFNGEAAGSAWVHPQGVFGGYGGNGTSPYGTPGGENLWWDAAFMQNYLVGVWGLASDYELPISEAARADHVAVRNHGYKQVVQRAGDGSAYNWRRFIAYAYPIGADSVGLPCEKWLTAAESYAALTAAYSLTTIPASEGLSLKAHSSDSDLVYGVSSLPYGASALMALAQAVDHQAPGAADGWRRVSTASNFATSFDPYFNTDNPSYGVKPRS